MAENTQPVPEDVRQKLLAEATKLITDTKFNYVRFNSIFEYLNRKVTFRKVDAKGAQFTIEGEGNDTTNMADMVAEALQFFIDEIKAGKITEVVDYRKFVNETVSTEGGHIKLTKKFNYNGREYDVTSITMPKNTQNGAIVEYSRAGENTRRENVSQMEESLLAEIHDVIKANKYL
jgi:hypothetical protein